MASGIDMQFAATKESTYGTRAVPAKFFEVQSADLGFELNHYQSTGLGGGLWRRRRVQTTQGGSGDIPMEVPTAGFGFWLDLLHGATTPTPVVQGATTAYLQTHTLSAAPNKSATVQIGVPPVSTSVLQPLDYLGVMVTGMEFEWEPGGVLSTTVNTISRQLQTNQTLATYAAPATSNLLSFRGGSMTIAGGAVGSIHGGGSLSIQWDMRDDAFALGSTGLMSKPVPTGLPTASGSFTADFEDLVPFNRVVNDTLADVVLTFQGAQISGIYYEKLIVTIPDCGFDQGPPAVEGPGPTEQEITFTNASTTADVPTIAYTSTDTTI